MTIYKNLLLTLVLCLFLNEACLSEKCFPDKANFIDAELFISVRDKHLEAKLAYSYTAEDSATTSLSFFLTPDAQIDAVEGNNIKDYVFDVNAKPFSTLTVYFKNSLAQGKSTDFSLSYSTKLTKGFWGKEYQWIDIDPDFMILPVFSTFENFTYHIYASVDDKNFTFYDLDKGQITEDIDVTSQTPSYYFNPILAGNNEANGMKLSTLKRKSYNIIIFSNKPDSVAYVSNAADRILDFFDTTFGENDNAKQLTALYRPLPYSLHKVTRSFDHSIVFARGHNDIPTLAHEVAHFWWNRGNALTTEKWLSESFAQYSRFMFIRHEQGEEKFKEIINDLAERTEKLPALLGKDRFSSQGNSLIYEKGPYLLYQLENKIGREKFIELLVALNHKKVATTNDMLIELEEITSAQTRKEFEEGLHK